MDAFLTTIPGYREAVEREQEIRETAFLDLTHFICGVEVVPLTPRKFLFLSLCKSPFVTGDVPTAAEVMQFLWVISPKFKAGNDWSTRRARDRFIRRHASLPYSQCVNEILQFIDEAFTDKPSGGGKSEPKVS